MRQAFAISVLVAIPAALLSCYLVLKGWSLMGDAVSHAVLPGIALAYLVGIPVALGAFAAGMFCAISTGFLSENSRVKEDTVMGVVFSGMFGLGIVLNTSVQTGVHLHHVLFGDMLGVTWRDVIETGAIAVVVVAAIAGKWRDLLLHAFDGQHARAIGLPVRLLHYGLLALMALAIVGGLKAVGIILVIALLIAPGAIAFLITRRFGTMLLASVAIAAGSSVIGIYLSFFIDSAPAPTIVLVMSGLFVIVFLFTQWRTTVTEKTVLATVPTGKEKPRIP
ncbi:MAG: metal ABC transporter permease [Rhizobiaceae bacterium]